MPLQSPARIVLAECDNPGQLAGPLVQAGFQIETVDTADAALRLCGITPVDLVITRVIFRYGITGVELVHRLQAMAAPPPVLMVAGVSSDRLNKIPGYPPPGVPLLRKPVVASALLHAVTSLMP